MVILIFHFIFGDKEINDSVLFEESQKNLELILHYDSITIIILTIRFYTFWYLKKKLETKPKILNLYPTYMSGWCPWP